MIRVVIAPEARDGLRQIWRYLANEAGLNLADRVREKLLAVFDTVARNPEIGHKREDLTSLPVRFYSVYRYLVVYAFSSDTIRILSIIHWKTRCSDLIGRALHSRIAARIALPRSTPIPCSLLM